MSFEIIEIMDARREGLVAKARHQDHLIQVFIPDHSREDVIAGVPFQAKIGFDKVLDWEIIDDFEDARSGIWQEQDGVHLLGRIHSVLDYGDGKTIIDVYIQNGLEIFQVDSETVEDADFEANNGLKITVGNLHIYPID